MDLAEACRHLGIDPARLEPAPAQPTLADYRARYGVDPQPCSACGQPARSSSILDDPQHGRRWVDRCRTCSLATPPALRVPLSEALADLKAIARDTGARLTVITDWEGERHD